MGSSNSTEIKELKENQQNINKEFGEKIDENKEILNLILARTSELINSHNEEGSGRIKFDEVVGPRINGHLKNIVYKESYKLSKDPDLVNQSTNVNPRMAKFAKHVLNGCKWVAKSGVGRWVAKQFGFHDEYAKKSGFDDYDDMINKYSNSVTGDLNNHLNNHLETLQKEKNKSPLKIPNSKKRKTNPKTSPKRKTNPKTSPKRKTNPKTSPKRKTNPKTSPKRKK